MSDIFETDFDHVFGSVNNSRFDNNDFGEEHWDFGHSERNIFGGEDLYDNDNCFFARTIDNGIGEFNLYSNQGYEGTIDFNDVGDDIFYGEDGTITHFDFDMVGNSSQIMQYDDPLAHVIHYIMPDLIL